MRIAYLSNSHIPSDQANSVHVVNMAAALSDLGHDVTLWVYRGTGTSQWSGADDAAVVAAHFGVRPGFGLRYYAEPEIPGSSSIGSIAAAITCRIQGVDLVIGRHPKACSAAALLGLPVAFESHQPLRLYPSTDRLFINTALKRRALRRLVTISKPLAGYLRAEVDAEVTAILVAHDAASSVDDLVPRRLGPVDRPQIGYVGHLYAGRGVEVIFALAQRIPEADFYLIGGTSKDVAYWRGIAADLPNITLTGFMSPAEAAAMRLGCDILLAPYQANASVPGGHVTTEWMSPLKIFEYMAAGKAFIVSDLPVLHEVLLDRRNCLLVPPADIAAWEAALRSILTDHALRDALGHEAHREFHAKYTWVRRAESIVEFAAGR
jgi:glycosyltransferase involved in cell wall biosynthesis